MDYVDAKPFAFIASRVMRKSFSDTNIWKRKFKAHFGVPLYSCPNIFRKIHLLEPRILPLHLLIGLHFLQCYNTADVASSSFRIDPKTWRTHAWRTIRLLARAETVSTLYIIWPVLTGFSFLLKIDFKTRLS